ncbi:uncharacterized protein LOC128734580 [Sabethes cyaneus]|uniref:uncharacterized protein LOC128734580 n=1 Tax=Sabethes cyaneus TaxID=53552 RepID=UPI00221E359B|nr:uncharacterized protein LOC128734580 [Sabethes cyaneus]
MSATENQSSVTKAPDAPQASEVKKETVVKSEPEAKPSVESAPNADKKADSSAETAPTAMETEPAAAANGVESKPAGTEAKASTDESKKANGAKKERPRFSTVARKRFRLLIGQGYSRNEAARLAQEPLKPNVATKGQPKAKFDFEEERKKLTGAAKKRLAWLLRNGYDEKEAIAQARKPMDTTRRGRFGRFDGPRAPTAFSLPANRKPVPSVIAMAVVKSDHPAQVLTREQSSKIKSGILKQVTQQKDAQLKPRFEDCVFVNGYLRVLCSDKPTVKFLQQNVPKLELWKDASVKVVNEKSILRIETYVGHFTDSRQNSNEEILNFVECQNDGLSTSNWKILGRNEAPGKVIELKFTMDPASTKIVRELGFELNYKFNKIKVEKVQKPAAPLQGSTAPPQRAAPVASRRYNPPRRTFVPVWENNMSKQTTFNRAPSPPRRSNFDSYGGNQFNSGSHGNNWGGNSNSFSSNGGSGGGGGGSGGGQSNSRPLSLVDNLFAQLNRTLAANDNRGNNRSGNSFNGRSNNSFNGRGGNSFDRPGSRRANNFGSGSNNRMGGRSFYNNSSRAGFF